jgi:hypothetical protein
MHAPGACRTALVTNSLTADKASCAVAVETDASTSRRNSRVCARAAPIDSGPPGNANTLAAASSLNDRSFLIQ